MRLIRAIFRVCWIVSLLLFAAVVAMWARSYWRHDGYEWSRRSQAGGRGEFQMYGLVSEAGQVDFHSQWYIRGPKASAADWVPEGAADVRHDRISMPAIRGRYDHLGRWGFFCGSIERSDLISRAMIVPHWFIAVSTAPLPLIAAYRWWQRRHRTAAGFCRACGYDLRASPGRCPECGLAFT